MIPKTASQHKPPHWATLNENQSEALALYDAGLNVFPVPYAQKGGWPWRQYQTTRAAMDTLLPALGQQRANLAVMTGHTSANLFVLDCENQVTLHSFIGEINRLGIIDLWVVQSGGPRGGGHIYFLSADGPVKNVPRKDWAKDWADYGEAELRGNTCYVLAPPSVHPDTGARYTWLERIGPTPPTVHLADLLPILPMLETATPRKSRGGQSTPPYSKATADYLADGDRYQEGTRNNSLFAALCDLAGCHMVNSPAWEQALDNAQKSGLPWQEVRDTALSARSQPREPSKPGGEQPLRHWQLAAAYADCPHWRGPTATTDRAVFAACIERARVDETNGTWRASVREVATLARVTPKTAHASLQRLVTAGLLEHAHTDRTSSANRWRFTDKVLTEGRAVCQVYHTNRTGEVDSVVILSQHDAAERGALGPVAWRVYQYLLTQEVGQRAAVIASALGIHRRAVYRALRRLRDFSDEHGRTLVTNSGGLWFARALGDVWLKRHVTDPTGTTGKGEARRAKFAQQRADRATRATLAAMHKTAALEQRNALPQMVQNARQERATAPTRADGALKVATSAAAKTAALPGKTGPPAAPKGEAAGQRIQGNKDGPPPEYVQSVLFEIEPPARHALAAGDG